VVFSSLTPHKTGPNNTQAIRKALIIQFIPHGAVRIDKAGDVALDDAVLNMRV
jgi:ectoine hydroxylase-related dioxygenase (phytanoyl-CoA dioxygenase family)